MKKFVALTLVLSLLLAVPALAEDQAAAGEEGATVEALQMDWNQDVIDAFAAAGLSGDIATFTLQDGLSFQMMIPEGFAQRELTEEEKQMGINLALANEATGSMIRILDSTLNGVSDVSGVAQGLLSMNPEIAIQFAVVNGTPAVISALPADDSLNITLDLGNSRFVQFDFSPLSVNNQLAQFFIASIQF